LDVVAIAPVFAVAVVVVLQLTEQPQTEPHIGQQRLLAVAEFAVAVAEFAVVWVIGSVVLDWPLWLHCLTVADLEVSAGWH
jgi:hypothetical protein